MVNKAEQYFERIGLKYVVGMGTILYIIGTALFNVYLRLLGIYEFNLIQLRYMFIGIVFVFFTAIFFGFVFLFWRLSFPLVRKVKKPTKRESALFWNRLEITVLVILIPWMYTYARYILPEIPSGLGGAAPIEARLIGSPEEIQRINELIAYETNLQPDKLPFEVAPGQSNLAIGANVLILDQSKDRLFLILTKELYLSSTSNLAKNLRAAGGNIGDIATKDTKDFQAKPLIINTKDIVSFTMNLYEPPSLLTRDDIEIAASVIAKAGKDSDQTQMVSDFLEQQAPEVAPQLLEAVQKKIEEKQVALANPTEKPSLPPVTKPKLTSEETEQQQQVTEEIVQELEGFFDTKFLDFRADIFGQTTNLCGYERTKGKDSTVRLELVREISRRMKADFPNAWEALNVKNYLADGQGEKDFSCNLVKIFQGAEDASVIVTRLNEKQVIAGPDFGAIRDEALVKLTKSSQINTDANRKYVSQLLIQHFNQKARQMNSYWNDSKYLYEGRNDEKYFENITTALTKSQSWESFGESLQSFYDEMEVVVPTPIEENTEVIVPPVGEEPYTGSGSTVDNTTPPADTQTP